MKSREKEGLLEFSGRYLPAINSIVPQLLIKKKPI